MTSTSAKPQAPPNNLIGLGLLATFLALGWALAVLPPGKTPLTFAFVLFGWVLAVMAHEFSHAAVAFLAGDHTVRDKGYLAFDPRRYADLGVSLVIPLVFLALGGIGFPGGAVYLRNDLMRSRLWRTAASLAGPAATYGVLLLLAVVLITLGREGLPNGLFDAIAMLAFLQATALLLNLLPLPGLDGFNALRPYLPEAWEVGLRKIEGLVFVGVFIAFSFIPGFSRFLFGGGAIIAHLAGVPLEAAQAGWDAFRFWT